MLFGGLTLSINSLRNIKGILLFLLSLKYCKEKNIISYMILNIIGSMFHITSLVYLPLYFILNMKLQRIIVLVIFFVGNVMTFLNIKWIGILLNFIATIFDNRLAFLSLRYLESDLFGARSLGLGFFERSFTFLLFYLLYPKLSRNDLDVNIFANLLYIYVFVFLFGYEISIFGERFSLLFVASYWVLYPKLFAVLKKEYKCLFLILLLIYGTLKIMNMHYGAVHEYDNILTGYKSYDERLKDYYRWRKHDSRSTLESKEM
jgi:hypothetical protein